MISGNMFLLFGIVGYLLCTVLSASIDPEIFMDDCYPSPCLHESTCFLGGVNSTFTCLCEEGYVGIYCETKLINMCDSNPCLHGSSCIPSGISSYMCICAPGYHGINCNSTGIDYCNPNPCPDCTTCIEGLGSYTCRLNIVVDINIQKCVVDLCQNGGTCYKGIDSDTCDCEQGFTGIHCETDVDECQLAIPVCGPLICKNSFGGYTCSEQS